MNTETGELVPTVRGHCTYLARIIWNAISSVVEGAFEAKEWMQECARQVAHTGKPVMWWVPETEFPVIQDRLLYWRTNKKRIETHLAGKVYRPAYRAGPGRSASTSRRMGSPQTSFTPWTLRA